MQGKRYIYFVTLLNVTQDKEDNKWESSLKSQHLSLIFLPNNMIKLNC